MPDYYVEGDDDIDGDDMYVEGAEDDILGAVRRRGGRGMQRRGGRRGMSRSTGGHDIHKKPPLPVDSAGRSKLRSFAGLGVASWTAADTTDKQLVVEPQESFRGERLVIDTLIPATSSSIVVVKTLFVGSLPQSPAVDQPAPAAMFRPDAWKSELDLQVADKAVKITLTLGIVGAPAMGDTVRAVAGLYGEWIR